MTAELYTLAAGISPPASLFLSWLAVSQASSRQLLCEVIEMQHRAPWQAHTDAVTDTWAVD